MAELDVVFLVPGFLGFERFEEFAYFGDRVGTALRALLSQRLKRKVVVLPVPLPPAGALSQRQYALGRTLLRRAQALAEAESRPLRIHLLGHSTGGVDAQLLTMERPLAGRRWEDFGGLDLRWLQDRIRSVTSLASPHQGTCFASDPIARWFASGSLLTALRRAPFALRRALPGAARLAASLPSFVTDPDLRQLLTNLLVSEDAVHFLWELLGSRELVDDLEPAACVGRYASLGQARPVHRRSFVTLAGITPSGGSGVIASATRASSMAKSAQPALGEPSSAPPDALFLLLAELSSGRATGAAQSAPLLPQSLERVTAALANERTLIAASRALLPEQFDASANDGVVNSVRQLIDPSDPHELAAVVIADHFDVVGHYDRSLWVSDPETGDEHEESQVAGLLHSGSRFRNDQFFTLMQRIAEAMEPAFQA